MPVNCRQRGSVLVTTLVLALLIGIVVAALLFVAQQQNYMTARTQIWSAEIPLAEAGLEEAMAHLNSRPSYLDTAGWQRVGSNFVKTRTFTNGYYYAAISTSRWPTIVSVGYGRIPLQTNFTKRVILANTKLVPGWGLVGKSSVSMNGNPYADSYDSSSTNYSTGGLYDPNKRTDQVGVGTLSTNVGAINTGGGMIYGSAATGPGGTVSGNVGDGAWLSSGSGQQPAHVMDDFNMAIPNVSLPSPWSPQTLPLLNQIISGVTYKYVLTAGDWQFGATDLSGGGIYVQGAVRIYFTGDFRMSGSTSVKLAPGATLDIYLGGNMDLSGDCVINPSGIPANCRIYGLPTCTSMKYAGNAEAFCQMYAPNADIRVIGDFDFYGSIVGNSVQLSGNAAFHYDEALDGDAPNYRVTSWEEL